MFVNIKNMYFYVKNKVLCFFVVVLFIGVIYVPNTSSDNTVLSDTLYVPDDYPTIQAAIDNANLGDTIIVKDGSYEENIVLHKSLTLISEDGANNTIITAQSSFPYVVCISVDNVVFRGFTVDYAGDDWIKASLYVNSNSNSISNNRFISSNQYHPFNGIWINASSDNIVADNYISKKQNGMLLSNLSCNNVILNNTLKDNYNGVFVEDSHSNNFSANKITDSDNGVYNWNSSDTIFYKNIFSCCENAALRIWYSLSVNVSFNVFNQNNWIYATGVEIFSSDKCNIFNNFINCQSNGIYQGGGNNNSIYYNQITNCSDDGIFLNGDDNCVFENNIKNVSDHGIRLIGSFNNVLSNNIGNSVVSGEGICLRGYSNVLEGNVISRHANGIHVKGFSNDTIVTKNILAKGVYGLYLNGGSYTTISENIFEYNSVYGLYMSDSSSNVDCMIYHNNFIENNVSNAFDITGGNVWDNGYPSGGNYWDDYNGTDADEDGIGDTPYNISGGVCQDRYPLMKPWFEESSGVPVACFSYSPHKPLEDVDVIFDASVSYDSDGEIVEYIWDFGDGNTGFGKKVTHSFSSAGDYSVSLTVCDNNDSQNTMSNVVTVGFYFVHITDTHIGAFGAKSNFKKCIDFIYSSDKIPEFLVISGDIVERGDALLSSRWYKDFKEILNGHNIVYYCAPGNHDYYKLVVPPWIGNLDDYNEFIDSRNRYSFTYSNTHFISLNSGCDVEYRKSLFPPRGAGIFDDDKLWLENNLDDLDGVRDGADSSDFNKIIFMHHPVINCRGTFWKRWGNGIISQNKEEFMNICNRYDVDLVLTGHTHNDKIYSRGDDGVNPDGKSAPIVCDETLYVQTKDCKKQKAFRKIVVWGEEVKLEKTEVAS